MSRWVRRVVLYVEALSTGGLGLVAVLAPALVLSKITDLPADPSALAVARQLGAAWVVIGVVECLLPFVRDARTLRMIVMPIFLGDILHAIAVWPWGAFALTHVIPTAIYAVNRASIVAWPESFIARRAAETRAPAT
jgi:hypothetical protein